MLRRWNATVPVLVAFMALLIGGCSNPEAQGSASSVAAADSLTHEAYTRADGPPGTAIPLSPLSPFLTRVGDAPLDSNSIAIVENLAEQVDGYWYGVAGFNAHSYNVAFYRSTPETPRRRVRWTNCQGYHYTPRGLYDGPEHFRRVPIPRRARPAQGSDHQLSVYDRASDTLWEFWNVRVLGRGRFAACWGGRIDNVSQSLGVFPQPFGASATGLSMSAGMISLKDLKQGEINHAMYLSVRDARVPGDISWPANRGDGLSRDPNVVRQGQRLRLDPQLDLSRYQLTPVARLIAEAAQKYGFIVSDKGGAVAVITESGRKRVRSTGADPWASVTAAHPNGVLQGFPWSHLQALPVDYGKIAAQ